jgi:hypothetical protein
MPFFFILGDRPGLHSMTRYLLRPGFREELGEGSPAEIAPYLTQHRGLESGSWSLLMQHKTGAWFSCLSISALQSSAFEEKPPHVDIDKMCHAGLKRHVSKFSCLLLSRQRG